MALAAPATPAWRRLSPKRAVQAAALAGLIAFVAYAAVGGDSGAVHTAVNNGIYNGLLLLAAGACMLRVVRVRAERYAWLALAVGMMAWTVGDLHYAIAYSASEEPPFPSPGDAFYLAFYPASYAALVLLVRSRVRAFRRALWVDGAMAALAAATLGAGLLLEFVLNRTSGSTAAVVTNLAYPLGDLVLLALVLGVFALSGWRADRAWAFMALGLLTAAVGDGIYLFQVAAGTYVEGNTLDALWPASMLLLAQAAWQRPVVAEPVAIAGRRLLIAPAVCGFAAVGILAFDHWHRTNTFALVLAVATLVAVIVRMDLTFSEKQRLLGRLREQALTDPITGLGNRRQLLDDLRSLLGRPAPPPTLLLLFDLDGFKRYNDTFGHPAGDALLFRLGRRLRERLGARATGYRLGGDEFCVLGRLEAGDGETLIEVARTALSDRGDGFEVGSSFGAVFIPDEATDAAEALRLADRRLYAQKAGKASGRGQPQDVLLQALYEREPELHQHVRAVATLAAAAGRKLGLDGPELDELLRAAELHDVGKLAVPDEVLAKPGPLDATEWAFIRRHTLVGQRILSASPALLGVARIVRSTHEHWDGSGYPDGLRGEEIPLAARIILAADAYVAMTSKRPYGSALRPDEARTELLRTSGSQFDPAVVTAVCAAQRELAKASLARRPEGRPASPAA